MTSYYEQHKENWKTKYNKDTYYSKTRSLRARNFMLVLEIPDTDISLKFRSKSDIQRFLKKVPFNFDTDFQELNIPPEIKDKIDKKIR